MSKNILKSKIEIFSTFVGLDVSYFAKGGFWLALSTIAVAAGGIFLSALFARLLAKDVFGQFSFLMSVLGFAGLAALPGMSQAVTQASAENKDGVFKSAILETGKWSVLGGLILILASIYYFISFNNSLGFAFLVSAIAFPISAAGALFNAFLSGKKQFRLVAIYGTTAQLASIAATGFALWKFPNLVVIALFSAWSTAIINAVLTFLALKHRVNDDGDSGLLKLGFHLSISQIFTVGADYLDRLFVPILLGFTNNAIYSFAVLIPLQLHGFFKVFTSLGQPKIADLSSKKLKRGIFIKSLQLELVIAAIVALYILTAPFIFKILYPSYQGEAVFLTQIFSLSLLYYPGNILSLLFLKQRNASAIHKTNIFYGLMTVTSLLVLVPSLGLLGAVLAKVVVRLSQLFVQLFLFSKLETGNN